MDNKKLLFLAVRSPWSERSHLTNRLLVYPWSERSHLTNTKGHSCTREVNREYVYIFPAF